MAFSPSQPNVSRQLPVTVSDHRRGLPHNSPGRSCPSHAAIGRAWVTQCEDWYYIICEILAMKSLSHHEMKHCKGPGIALRLHNPAPNSDHRFNSDMRSGDPALLNQASGKAIRPHNYIDFDTLIRSNSWTVKS